MTQAEVPAVTLAIDLLEVEPAITDVWRFHHFSQRLPLADGKLFLRRSGVVGVVKGILQAKGILSRFGFAHHSFDQLRLAFQAEYPLWIRRRRVSIRDRRLRWFLLSRGRRSEQEETSQCQPNYQSSGKGGSLASASG